jgi:predicted N-formylglutamate amidohydrolase
MSNADDNPAFRFHPGHRLDVLIVCDHASHALPAELGSLGLADEQRHQHLAWDPGAAGVAAAMADELDCPALFAAWSRLVVDLNRAADAPDLIVQHTDGIDVPGNRDLAPGERARRIDRYHVPYHLAISRHLDDAIASGRRPALVSVHSFTPTFNGIPRPWPVGLLWKHQTDWLEGLFEHLRRRGLEVGDNRPYDGREMMGGTLDRHALARGLRHVLIELRQDLLETDQAQRQWAAILTDALRACGFLQPEPARRPVA